MIGKESAGLVFHLVSVEKACQHVSVERCIVFHCREPKNRIPRYNKISSETKKQSCVPALYFYPVYSACFPCVYIFYSARKNSFSGPFFVLDFTRHDCCVLLHVFPRVEIVNKSESADEFCLRYMIRLPIECAVYYIRRDG